MRVSIRLSLVALAVFGAACTVQDTTMPPLAGPSELGLRVALQAVPDSILQDGFSQAAIQIEATNADGRPARALTLRVQTQVAGVVADIGTLSTKTVVTGDDGRARVTYTSPPRPAQQIEPFTVVTFLVEPVGTDYRGEVFRTVDLRLVVPGIIQPPPPRVALPRPSFTVTGNAVATNVVFDASATTYDRGTNGTEQQVPCGALCTYTWDFGDGTTGSGIFASHQYRNVARYQVRLTVTDPYGQTASAAQAVEVGTGNLPTASFTVSPSAPAVNQQIFFNAEASRAAPGRTLVSYDWNFGNGRTGTGVTQRQTFSEASTYTVTLTVTDDAGNQATTTQSVTVSRTGTLQAVLTVSPTNGGTTSTLFQFDGAASTPGASPIIRYRFNFGIGTDGWDQDSTTPVATYQFPRVGTFQVSLQVEDSQGRTSIARIPVTVAGPGGGGGGNVTLQARLKASPTSGSVSTTFTFDASESTPSSTSVPIVEYVFFFVENLGENKGANPVATKVFTTTGTKIVEVRIKDQNGNISATSVTVTVQ